MPIAQHERERESLFVFVLEAQLGLLFFGQPGRRGATRARCAGWQPVQSSRPPASGRLGGKVTDPVTVERDGHVLLIGVNRPAQRNAFDLAVIEALGAAYETLGTDQELRAGVLFGHGDHFSAGLDLAQVGPVVARDGPGALGGSHASIRPGSGVTRCPSRWCWPSTASPTPCRSSLPSPPISWWPLMTCVFASWRSAAGSCRSAAPPSAHPRSSAGQRDALPAHRRGVRRRRGAADRAGPGGRAGWTAPAAGARTGPAHRPAGACGVQGTLANARAGRSHGPDAAREHLLSLLPGILHSQDAAEGLRSFTERREGRFTGH